MELILINILTAELVGIYLTLKIRLKLVFLTWMALEFLVQKNSLLIFDEKVANDVFDIKDAPRADTIKVQQKKQLAEARKPKNLTKIIQSVMPRRSDSLLQILGAGEMGHLLGESVGLFLLKPLTRK